MGILDKLNNAISIDPLAGFIALVALILAIYQGFQTRKSAKLSVRPLISWKWHTDTQNKIPAVELTIQNSGNGAAFIRSLGVRYKPEPIMRLGLPSYGDVIAYMLDEQSFRNIATTLLGNIEHEIVQHGSPGLDEYLASGDNLTLFRIEIVDPTYLVKATDKLKGVEYFTDFQSLYLENFECRHQPYKDTDLLLIQNKPISKIRQLLRRLIG